jgi:coiled-coil domain-containing protein 55
MLFIVQPKYIDGLLSSAATRKLDHLRAEEKMMQREREREGDEFRDKDSFVTQPYKDQMAKVRKAEEDEKLREGAASFDCSSFPTSYCCNRTELAKANNRGVSTGMAHFYRKLLEESEQKHEETVAATEQKRPIIGPQAMPNLTISKPPNYTPKSDLELAQIARGEGKEVELNDDNQIVDKLQLLSPGLNLSAPNTRRLGLMKSGTTTEAEKVQLHRAVGSAASKKEINDRRAREIQEQVKEEEARIANELDRIERETTERAIARRNTEEDVKNARERYLERKRRKLEEQDAERPDIMI